jgi:predicted dehydrogenase
VINAGHLEDALRIECAVEESGLLFGLTHTYTGYPMVIEARARIAAGEIGQLRRVAVSYLQDWLSRAADTSGSKQAAWRSDPARVLQPGANIDYLSPPAPFVLVSQRAGPV